MGLVFELREPKQLARVQTGNILSSKRNCNTLIHFICSPIFKIIQYDFFGTKMFGRRWLNFYKDDFVIETLENMFFIS